MWSDVIGQDRVKNILKNIFGSGRISHAYIFYGNKGVGKDAAAVEFAKLVNCENPVNNEPCDECKSCKDISSLRSQLFRFITALPSGKNESDNDTSPLEKLEKEDFDIYREEIENKAADKYHVVNIPRANDIRISSIRQIRKEIYMTGSAGKKKIFLISEAEKMNPQSANSLLKILEEPPGDSMLILTTSEVNSLLPTISGRCQKIKFGDLSNAEVAKYIKDKDLGLSPGEVSFYAQLSGGSISKCNNILENNFLELREKVLDVLSSIITNQYLKLGSDIEFITSKKDKDRIRQFLILLAVWFRDVISKTSGNDEMIVNKDKLERLAKFVEKFDSENYKIINLIEEAIMDIDRNIFPDLLLFNLTNKIRMLIRKKV